MIAKVFNQYSGMFQAGGGEDSLEPTLVPHPVNPDARGHLCGHLLWWNSDPSKISGPCSLKATRGLMQMSDELRIFSQTMLGIPQ